MSQGVAVCNCLPKTAWPPTLIQLGAEAIFVGSGIFKSEDPKKRAEAIVLAATHYNDPDMLARVSEDLGEAMPGIEISKLAEGELLQRRGV